MKKHLVRVHVGHETYDYLEQTCRQLLSSCRHIAVDGTPIFYPDLSGAYPAMWTRDFAYMVEYAGELLDPGEILGAIDYILARQREDGALPDRVGADGVPVYLAGPADHPLGSAPPTDNAQFMVKALFAYFQLTSDFAGFLDRRDALYRAMDQVPISSDNLVYIDHNRPHASYGFVDTVRLTGNVHFCSLLYWEACNKLAQILRRCEYHDQALDWYETAERMGKQLEQFHDQTIGMFRAVSGDCSQTDLWGSAYACVIRAASKRQADETAAYFLRNWDSCFWRGHVRHLPAGEYWQRLLVHVPGDTYQNGAYWAVPTGWCAQTIALVNSEAASRLIAECVAFWQEQGVHECISPDGKYDTEGYVASAVNLLGACMP